MFFRYNYVILVVFGPLSLVNHSYINLNPGRLFVQQPPKNGNGSRGSLKLLRLYLQQGKTTIASQDN